MATATPPSKISLPPVPDVFNETPSNLGSHSRPYRRSFSTVRERRASNVEDDTPKLPTLVPGIRPAYSTPLPALPMIVLCIVRSILKGELTLGNVVRAIGGKLEHTVPFEDGRR